MTCGEGEDPPDIPSRRVTGAGQHHANVGAVSGLVVTELATARGPVVCIPQKAVQELLDCELTRRFGGRLPTCLELAYYGALTGLDRWRHAATLIVIGRPRTGAIARTWPSCWPARPSFSARYRKTGCRRWSSALVPSSAPRAALEASLGGPVADFEVLAPPSPTPTPAERSPGSQRPSRQQFVPGASPMLNGPVPIPSGSFVNGTGPRANEAVVAAILRMAPDETVVGAALAAVDAQRNGRRLLASCAAAMALVRTPGRPSIGSP
jgi:hypothetical protein